MRLVRGDARSDGDAHEVRTNAIEIRGLTKAFADVRVLDRVDLTVRRGESLVVLGLSGSGKSVLFRHITGYIEPDAGTVTVLGRDWSALREDDKQDLRRRFGIVFQNAALFDSLTIEENIALPLSLRATAGDDPGGTAAETVRRQAAEALEAVGLSEAVSGRRPLEVSGGMQKRAAIARALAMRPELVFYDEPTTGLDPRTGDKISRLIRAVHEANDATTSYTITHDYRCAAWIADRIVYLDKQTGRLETVLSADAIRAMREQAARVPASADDPLGVRSIQEYLERFIRNRPEHVDDGVAPEQRLTLGGYLADVTTSFVSMLGALFFLFASMGIPLRGRDLVDRVFSAGVHSFPLMMGAGFFVGMTGMVQFYIGVGSFKELLPISLPGTLTSAMMEIISPLLVGVLLAGRVGANITTEIGSKGLLSQIDALESLAISPKRFLLAPIVWALAITAPMMALLATFSGVLGGFLMWSSFGEPASEYWRGASLSIGPASACYAMGKAAVTGVLVGLVGYQQGSERLRGTDDIAAASTRTVLICALLVVLADFLMSDIYTRILGL